LEPDFAASLKKGVDAAILTEKQAKSALKQEVETVFAKGLETGLEAANVNADRLLESGVQANIVSKDEAALVDASIQSDVDV
jgi:hypothetical protein